MKFTPRGDTPFCRDWSDPKSHSALPGVNCAECGTPVRASTSECMNVVETVVEMGYGPGWRDTVLVCTQCADTYRSIFYMEKLVRVE